MLRALHYIINMYNGLNLAWTFRELITSQLCKSSISRALHMHQMYPSLLTCSFQSFDWYTISSAKSYFRYMISKHSVSFISFLTDFNMFLCTLLMIYKAQLEITYKNYSLSISRDIVSMFITRNESHER